jgi:hypothetical protein
MSDPERLWAVFVCGTRLLNICKLLPHGWKGSSEDVLTGPLAFWELNLIMPAKLE